MDLKITVLIENTTDSQLQCEHGLSLYIEYDGHKILLDAGSTEGFAENAKSLGIDLAAVDMAFLSHGHYDHSGGFGTFIRKNEKAPVYAMETALGSYASTSGGILHEIGVPQPVKEVLNRRIKKVREVTKVAAGITLVPHSTSASDLKRIGERAGLYRGRNNGRDLQYVDENRNMEEEGLSTDTEWIPDDFAHEMSVVFETDAGLIICNSCSHGGLQNIVEEVKAVFPGEKVCGYIGGLHMKGRKGGEEICTFTRSEVKALTDYIKAEGMEMVITGHCTGAPAIKLLGEALKDGQLHEMCSGRCFDINM